MTEELPLVDFSKLKKKRPKTIAKPIEFDDLENIDVIEVESTSSSALTDDCCVTVGKDYTYSELLKRVCSLIKTHNPHVTENVKMTLKAPVVTKAGSLKSAWQNFQEICNDINRPLDHVQQFILSELGTDGNIDGSNVLLLKGRYQHKHIEDLLKKYITEYVKCRMCKSPNTFLKKDQATRLQTITCSACGSSRTVAHIKVNKKK